MNDEGDFVGFDVVIGNPPYVRQEEFTGYKSFLEKNYQVFSGTADLLVYFIEKGVTILKPNGAFQFIIANKFLRAGFGKPLRKYLMDYQIEKIIDFGDLPVFQEATTYPCIISLTNQSVKSPFMTLLLDNLHIADLKDNFESNCYQIDQNELNIEGWTLGKEITNVLLKKICSVGLPLDSYMKGNVFRGILTGLNEAFVIEKDLATLFLNQESGYQEVVKSFLEGKAIKRYPKPLTTKSLILIKNKYTSNLFGKVDEQIALESLNRLYPLITKHLLPFELKAKKRLDKGEYWWELRPCDYYDEFEKPKIIYPNICRQPEFTYDTEGIYTNQKCFIIPTDDKYLLGILNSSVTFFLFRNILPKLRGDFYEPSYLYLKDFPIATSEDTTKEAIAILVDQVLENKQMDIDTAPLEAEIDQLVYQLYGLTEEEIKIVEGIDD